MKLDTCLLSGDLNPFYLDFFPLVHRVWRELAGVRAVLALVADHVPAHLKAFSDDIVLVPPIASVHPGFQAQCVRLLLPQLLGGDDPGSAILISDLDILPANADYFLKPIKRAVAAEFVIYRSDASPDLPEIIICYNAAAAQTWRELVEPVSSIDEANAAIKRWYAGTSYDGRPGGSDWTTDQRLLFQFVSRFDQSRIVRYTDRQLQFSRLERLEIGETLSRDQRGRLKQRRYADYHMKRPHAEFRRLNEEAASLVLTRRVTGEWPRRVLRWLKR